MPKNLDDVVEIVKRTGFPGRLYQFVGSSFLFIANNNFKQSGDFSVMGQFTGLLFEQFDNDEDICLVTATTGSLGKIEVYSPESGQNETIDLTTEAQFAFCLNDIRDNGEPRVFLSVQQGSFAEIYGDLYFL